MSRDFEERSRFYSVLFRLYWFVLGHAGLIFCLISFLKKTPGLLGLVLYFLLCFMLLFSKYADVKYFNGMNADGDGQATMSDVGKFCGFSGVLYFFLLILILFTNK